MRKECCKSRLPRKGSYAVDVRRVAHALFGLSLSSLRRNYFSGRHEAASSFKVVSWGSP